MSAVDAVIRAVGEAPVTSALSGAFALLLAVSPGLRRLMGILPRFLVAFVCIHFERRVWLEVFGFRLPLPRDLDEVLADPEAFFKLLVDHGVVDRASELVSISRHVAIKSEPSKNKTAGSLCIRLRLQGVERTLNIFAKFQTGRGMPVWLQALRQAAEPNVCREVDFYAKVQPHLGDVIRTPQPLLTAKLPWLNYVLLILEFIDLENEARVINDGDGANLTEITAMMVDVAKLHSRFGQNNNARVYSWIPAHAGLEYAGFVDSFVDRKDRVWSFALWQALRSRFAKSPVTLVHGDCRPGNMMFLGHDRTATEQSVLFADWEAVNVAPYLWDLTYCTTLGWPAKSRRLHQRNIIGAYLKSLDNGMTLSEALLDVECLTLVLAYVSRVVRQGGFWNQQGNTAKDQRAWVVRVLLAVSDVDPSSLAAQLKVQRSAIDQVQADCAKQVEELREDKVAEDM